MGDYETAREALRADALRVKFVLLSLGVIPLVYIAIEFILIRTIDPGSLEQMGSSIPKILLLAIFSIIAILSVTIAPRLVYNAIIKNRFSGGMGEPPADLGGILILFPAIATTPADLGIVLFFLVGFYASLPFHLLSLICVWRFNLGIDTFLDRMANDIVGR
jgi:hypothetical protein